MSSRSKSPSKIVSKSRKIGSTSPSRAPLFDESDETWLAKVFQPHSISILLILLAILMHYAAKDVGGTVGGIKRGVVAMGMVLICVFSLQARDGLLVRPHPIVWRAVMGAAVVYLLICCFVLFLSVDAARELLFHIDPDLGVPLPDRSFATDCRVLTPGDPRGEWANVRDAFIDEFFVAHLLGWFGKALILRDVWLTVTYSAFFELLEITFAHQLDNFAECWWDQIVLDFLLANGLGIYLGLLTCRFLSMRQYDWVGGIRHVRSARGKAVRVAQQLLPASFEPYEWRIMQDPRRLIYFVFAIFLMSNVELNAFYLKTALWLPPSHPIVIGRLVLWWFIAIPGMREFYQFVTHKSERKLGTMAWLSLAIVLVESLIIKKFGEGIWDAEPMPASIRNGWILAVVIGVAWAVWHFSRINSKKNA